MARVAMVVTTAMIPFFMLSTLPFDTNDIPFARQEAFTFM
ncbi:hypothetical protein URH17368_1081 [Alicyclobacillus hesperidum URH17-3-68]|nr:hypothetical protein URH17368_1081 [Alicyclobacillus hesperidum URH17-3-68]